MVVRELLEAFHIGELNPLSQEECNELYATSFALYGSGAYEEALPYFTQLVLTNPFEESYWFGLASTYQMSGKLKEAVQAWAILALLKDENPLPHFHAGECLISLEEKEEAQKALCAAQERLKGEQKELREKIELLRQIHA